LDDIKYFEINTHTKHEELEINKVSNNEVKSQYEILEFATKLIKNNLSEDLEFHNLYKNKIFWKKSKIRNLLFKLREDKFPKEEFF
jgi:hypothetical protein